MMNLQNELGISNERQESKAETYLRSILDNDDQQINKNKSQKVCLKVPPRLRNSERSKDYYDPNVVSFGPYHHKKAELQAAQSIKTKVIRNFISDHKKKIKDLYIKVHEQIDHVRSCYVDDSTKAYDDEEFALMMLQDGCFILFLIECWTDKEKWSTYRKDNILMISNHLGALEVKCLYRDLLLLENQIPFRVLNVLMSNIYEENKGLTMIKSYLHRTHWGNFQKEDKRDEKEEEPHHFLGLLKTLISRRSDHVETVAKNVADFQKEDKRDEKEEEPHHLLGLLKTLISRRSDHVETVAKNVETVAKNVAENVETVEMETVARNVGLGMNVTRYLQSFGSVTDLQADHVETVAKNVETVAKNVAENVETVARNVGLGMNVTRYLQSFGSVTDLQAKGINFKPNNSISLHSAKNEKPKSISLRDVEFRSGFFTGELKLPPLVLCSDSEGYYKNLIASEMCALTDFTVASYITFMNSLIANPEDVKVLRSKHIILHTRRSDEEVFKMLKQISAINWVQDFSIYQGVREKIEKHYNNKIKILIAEVRHKYFSHPWSAIGLLAAIVVLILAFLQTFFTIYPRKA